ncbi:MAG: hypothetical protein ABFD96_20485, partial [Armatimonadia bacterium]
MTICDRLLPALDDLDLLPRMGQVTRSVGLIVESSGPRARIGDLCEIRDEAGASVRAEVVGFRGDDLVMMPLGRTEAIAMGSEVRLAGAFELWPSEKMLGRVLDGLGQPLDGLLLPRGPRAMPVIAAPPSP